MSYIDTIKYVYAANEQPLTTIDGYPLSIMFSVQLYGSPCQALCTRSVFSLSCLIVALFVLSGCLTDSPPPTAQAPSSTTAHTAGPTPSPTSQVSTPTPKPTATPFSPSSAVPTATSFIEPEGLERGGILAFAVPQGPPHLDPHLTVSSALLSWGAGQSYSRLFRFENSVNNSVVICDLCAYWVQISPITFQITLREGVRWQNLPPVNGRELTAQDVVFSLKRQSTPGFPNAALLTNVADFVAVGDRDVIIRLAVPDSEVLEKLADSHSRIVAPEAVEVHGDLRQGPTVGTGSWITSEAQPDWTSLKSNPDYYNNQLPLLDGLAIQVVPSAPARVAGMRTRIIDLAQAGVDEIASATEKFEHIEWISIPNAATGVEISMNTRRTPMNHLTIREGMMLTWDPETWNGELWHEQVSMSVGLPAFSSRWQLPVNEYFSSKFNDLPTADKLVASVGFSSEENVVIKVGEYGEQYVEQAIAMAAGLSSIGISADVERVSTRVFGDEIWIGGNYDIAVGAPPPISSTSAYLFSVHHSDGPWNTTGYSNPEIDRLIEAQAREYDLLKRGELLRSIRRLILAGSHRFISATHTTNWMWWDYVHDFNPRTPRGDTDFLTTTWVTEKLR